MIRKLMLSAAVALAAVAALATPAFAWDGHHRFHHGGYGYGGSGLRVNLGFGIPAPAYGYYSAPRVVYIERAPSVVYAARPLRCTQDWWDGAGRFHSGRCW